MALYWDWNKDKVGTMTMHGMELTLYSGNALLIGIEHLPDDFYCMQWFALDFAHLKNMLGISKDESLFDSCGIKNITLSSSYRHTAKIVQLLLKAGVNCTITIVPKP